MLARNPGLKELCHSITGGALVAQGYWIPYEAAKAVAATFCWHIRYALTPVFGKDFPSICLPPNNENFGSMQIDPEITKYCAAQAWHYRELETQATPGPSPGLPRPRTPQTPKARPQLRKILPKPYKETDSTSEYSTDTGSEDKYELSSPSPQIAFTNPWSSVNSPRSPSPRVSFTNPWSPASTTRSSSPHGTSRKGRNAANIPRSHTPLDLLPPPLKPLHTAPSALLTSTTNKAAPTTPAVSPRSDVHRMDVDEDYDAGSDDSDGGLREKDGIARKKSSRGLTETKAAYVLMKLKTQTQFPKRDFRSLKRRASACKSWFSFHSDSSELTSSPLTMSNTAGFPHNRLYTCRYWALGPECPNMDAFRTVSCDFAHYDTGDLASHVQQRGTCLAWKQYGFCGRGVGCWYEHRDTGVTGLYQGTVELDGLELQVADAAAKAGFNTYNHEALFDLIWAVKRLALRAGASRLRSVPPPPKDPIYPDRYRPSGIGDNTKKKRRPLTIHPPPNRAVELKFHPIKPLMRKRPLEDADRGRADKVIDLTAGSDIEDLIDLTNPSGNTSKRQKVAANKHTKPRPSTGLGTFKGLNASSTPIPPAWDAQSKSQRKRGGRRAKAAQAIPRVPLTAANAVPMVPKKPLTAEEEIAKQLLLAKTRLEEATTNMNNCQATMKALFDRHYAIFDNDETMMALQKLSNHMNKVYDGGKDGAGEIDKAMALLNIRKDGAGNEGSSVI
ncbi:hypothetical protein CLCR_02262 [Cladophialophora carrionii]|uniref:HTH APSES-type domain-containing protein n=1 Tax=Cladophialophora carrionii TaxID=86049 RepID=A0A1C1CFI1_9EURO|nr:hypothetical protein CLCR_02262 [Cladophialophora carrionii]